MANNCKQCFNTHYQPYCHPLPKSYGCVAVYIAAAAANRKNIFIGYARRSQVQILDTSVNRVSD